MARYRGRLTSKGQITIPRQVRQALGIQSGDDVAFEVGPDGVRLLPERQQSRFRAYEGRWRVGNGLSADDTDRWLRDLRGEPDS